MADNDPLAPAPSEDWLERADRGYAALKAAPPVAAAPAAPKPTYDVASKAEGGSWLDDANRAWADSQVEAREQNKAWAEYIVANPATQANMGRAADLLRLHVASKLPYDEIDKNFDAVNAKFGGDKLDMDSIFRRSPALSQYMQDPWQSAAIRDEIQDYSNLEAWMGKFRSIGGGPSESAPKALLRGYGDLLAGTSRSLREAYDRQGLREGVLPQVVNLASAVAQQPMAFLLPLWQDKPSLSQKAWDNGVNSTVLAYAALEASWSGKPVVITPALISAITTYDTGGRARGFFSWMAEGASQAAPGQIESIAAAAGPAATGGSLTGPYAPLATMIGAGSGAFLTMGRLEGGLNYWQMQQAAAQRGVKFDGKNMRYWAWTTGALNGGLELIPEAIFLKPFMKIGAFRRVFTNEMKAAAVESAATLLAKDALPKVSLFRAFGSAMAQIAVADVAEAGVEGIQQGVSDVALEGAIGAAGGPTDYSYIPQDMKDASIAAAVAFLPMMVIGGGATFHNELQRKRNAVATATDLFTSSVFVQAIKTGQTKPEQMLDIAKKMADANEHPPFVFVTKDAFDKAARSVNTDPRELSRLLSGSDAAYDQASEAEDRDVAIPYEAFLARIAPDKALTARLMQSARYSPGDALLSDYATMNEDQVEFMGEKPEEYDQSARRLYDMYVDAIPDHPNLTDEMKDHAARVFTSFIRAAAKSHGATDAAAWYEAQGKTLNIRREGTTPAGQATLNQRAHWDTPGFKKWFGRSAVVNEDGTPKRMFHSTGASFDEFKAGSHFGTAGAANDRAEMLNDFSVNVVGRKAEESRVVPVYLAIENLLRMPDLASQYMTERGEIIGKDEVDDRLDEFSNTRPHPMAWESETDLSEWLYRNDVITSDEFWEVQYSPDEAIALLKEKGYDGIVYNNAVEDAGNDSYIIFDPLQVKSAIGNVGTYDPSNRSILYQRQYNHEADASTPMLDWEPERTKDGKILGVPENVNDRKSPSARTAAWNKLLDELRILRDEGLAARYWYENSAREVQRRFPNDIVAQEKFIQLLAIYSPQSAVFSNTMFAVRAWTQWANGISREDFHVSTADRDAKAMGVLFDNAQWDGRKTGSFYGNLMHEIWMGASAAERAKLNLSPEVLAYVNKPVTIDLWMYRAAGYKNEAGGDDIGSGRYSTMEKTVQKLTAELNAALGPNEEQFIPHQVQAMIWAGMKARWEIKEVKRATNTESLVKGFATKDVKGKIHPPKPGTPAEFEHKRIWRRRAMAASPGEATKQMESSKLDFGGALQSLTHSITAEVIPAPALMSPITRAALDAKVAFTRDVQKRVLDGPEGLKALTKALGVGVVTTEVSTGGFDRGINPGIVISITPNKEAGDFSQVEANAVARAIQAATQQEAVPYFRPEVRESTVRGGKKGQFRKGFKLTFRTELDPLQERLFFQELIAVTVGDMGYTFGEDRRTMTVINFNTELLTDEAFTDGLDGLIERFTNEIDQVGEFGSAGEYGPSHDWGSNPEFNWEDENGESLLGGLSPEQRSSVQSWVDHRQLAYKAVRSEHEKALAGAGQPGVRRAGEEERGRDVAETPEFHARPRQPGAAEVLAVHYSPAENLTSLDPARAGTGARGTETRRFGTGQYGKQGGFAARLYFYIRSTDALPVPENMVSGKGVYQTKLTNLYDLRTDSLGIVKAALNQDGLEEAISSAGFDGFIAEPSPSMSTPYAVLFNLGDGVTVPVENAVTGDIQRSMNQRVMQGSHVTELEGGAWSDQFIGSGEDTQGQGFGHYFTSLKSVAEWYRRSNSFIHKKSGIIQPNGQEYGAEPLGTERPMSWSLAINALREYGSREHPYDKTRALADLNSKLEIAEKMEREWGPSSTGPGFGGQVGMRVHDLREAINLIEEDAFTFREPGNVFEAEIPDDHNLMHWDEAVEDQPPQVLERLKASGLLNEVVQWRSDLIFDSRKATDDSERVDAVARAWDLTMSNSAKEMYSDLAQSRMSRWIFSSEAKNEPGMKMLDPTRANKLASAALRDAGIPGHTYKSHSGNKNFVIFDPAQAQYVSKLYQAEANGFISFTPGGEQFDITLLDGANVSTLIHETMHYMVNVLGDAAQLDTSSEQGREDYKTLLKWMGYASHEERFAQQREAAKLAAKKTLTPTQQARLDELTEKEEKLARGFEKYIMEGRVPNAALAPTFTLMRAWLTKIYRYASRLNVELTDEVRGVFDRMVAADDAIAQDNQQSPFVPDEQARANMTDAERQVYDAAAAKAQTDPQDELRARLIRDQKRTLEEWFKQEREAIRAEIEKSVGMQPLYLALNFLQKGTMPEGVEIPKSMIDEEGKPLKLGRDSMERYDKALMKIAQKLRIYQAQGGLDADTVASLFGFENARAMIQQMYVAPTFGQAVFAGVEAEVEARYPDLLKDQAKLAEEATLANLSDARAEQLLIEIRVLARMAKKEGGTERMPISAVKMGEAARASMENRRLNELAPHIYLQRMIAAGREAASKQTAALRWDARVKQLWNLSLYRAARDAKAEFEKHRSYAQKAGEASFQAKLGKAGAMTPDGITYRDAVNEVLYRTKFKKESGKAADRRVSLRAWSDEQVANHGDSAVAPWLLEEAATKSYREMTLSEIRDTADSIKNIYTQAHLKNTLIGKNGARILADEVLPAMLSSMKAHNLVVEPQVHDTRRQETGTLNRAESFLKGFHASLLKIEEIVRRNDGNQVNGPWATYLWNPIVAAQNRERDLTIDITSKLMLAIEKMTPSMRKKFLGDERVLSKVTGQEYTWLFILSAALNTGNATNYERLLNVPRMDPKWGPDVVNELLDHLSTEEMDFVQDVWNILEGLWPEIAALETRQTGLPPPKVERQPFSFKGKTYEGGYYPLRYDARDSRRGQLQDAAGTHTAILFDHNYNRAMTPHGHVQGRVSSFGDPLKLSLSVLPSHIQSVIHDLTHREAILSINKILTDPDMHYAMIEHLGQQATDQFGIWLRGLANDQNRDLNSADWIDTIQRGARRNTSIVAMGFKATMFWQNFANIFGAMDQVKSRHLAAATKAFYEDRGEMLAFIQGKSGEMKHRFNQTERDVRDVVLAGLSGGRFSRSRSKITRAASYMTALSDAAVAYPVWLGAYRQGLEDKMSDEDAVAFADRSVRLTLGGSGQKDLANVQRNSEFLKIFTMFYTFFSTQYNQLARIGWDTRISGREKTLADDWPMLLMRALVTVGAQALVAEYLSGRGPDDDEEKWRWAVRKAALFPFLTVPMVREGASYVAAKAHGDYARDIKYGQVGPVVQEITDAIVRDYQWVAGDSEIDKELVKRNTRAIGYISGLPVQQAIITGGYLWDIADGTEDPDSFWEFGRNAMFTRRKK